MSKVLYIEPDDEITDLVEKIRRSGEEQDLVFVLPNRTKVLQSPLNLRLLQQYSRSFVKHTAIVSGDPRVQQMAKNAGFPTFASVQAYERGVEVVRPHAPFEPLPDEEDGHGEAMAPVGTAAAAGAGIAQAWSQAPVAERAPALQRADRAMPPRRVGPAPLPKHGRDRRRAYYYAAGAVFLVGLLLLFLVAPSATVTITLTATPISTSNPIQGTTDANLAGSPDHVLTTVASADETSQFQAKPTGQKTLPATAASGNVVLQTDLKNVADFTIPKGTEFDSNTTPQIKFYATQDTVVHFGDPDQNGISTSNPIPIQDGKPEGAGNLPANTVTQWPGNPCGPNGQYKGVCAPSDLTVTNPQPTSGGADAKQVTTASASDVQGWQQQVTTLKQQLTDKVKQDMQGKAGAGRQPAVDPGGSGQTISNDITPLPNADDQYQTTTITVTVHGKGAFYNPADVKKIVLADLTGQIAQGEQLAPNPTIPDPKITQASDDGTIIFSDNATGYSEPVIDVQGLKDRFAGKSQSDVKSIAREIIGSPVQDVTIDQHIPFFVLPFFSGHIEVKQNVIQKPSQ
ncbi:MAG TPA: hypothetical protein VFC09_10640 [Candidatus Dormibacteraeota bacterium]|nr:hypothetical protein [Candidatus Dormibacteraeota bacterium]